MNIYISNLDSELKDAELKALFQPFGEVTSAEIQYDAFTGVSRGFGNVEMPDDQSALKAIAVLNGSAVGGRNISVGQAAPKIIQKGSYKVGNGSINIFKFKKNK